MVCGRFDIAAGGSSVRQSEAWLLQIASDFAAAELLFQNMQTNPVLRCQALAKYQQVVEKSVKAMVPAVEELGIRFMTVTRDHVPAKEIDALLSLRQAIRNTAADYLAEKVLTRRRKSQILALCRLAPQYPVPGQAFLKNTEYPFNSSEFDLTIWTAPAAMSEFSEEEVQAARELAWTLMRHVKKFVSSVRRGRL